MGRHETLVALGDELMRGPMGYYRLDGTVVTRCTDFWLWMAWFEEANIHVAEHHGEGWKLSTVFLGQAFIDHDQPPLIFETALFANGCLTHVLSRYVTWDEAHHGHWVFLGKVPHLLAQEGYRHE